MRSRRRPEEGSKLSPSRTKPQADGPGTQTEEFLLQPPEFASLTPKHRGQAIDALAQLLLQVVVEDGEEIAA